MKTKKILSSILAVSILFCFASCSKTDNNETTPTTTQPTSTTTQPAPSTTQPAPSTTQPAPSTTQPAPSTTQPAPTDALSVFNSAVANGKPVNATYDRTAVSGEFKSGSDRFDSLLNGFIGGETLTPQNGTGLPADASAFTSMTAENIASSDINDNGTSYSLTFHLNSTQVSVNDKPSKGGYMFFMDGVTALGAIQKANAQIVMKNEGTVDLSDGILTVTVDKSTQKLTSAKLTLKEVYHDEIDLSKFNVPSFMASLIPEHVFGTFGYDLSVNYTF